MNGEPTLSRPIPSSSPRHELTHSRSSSSNSMRSLSDQLPRSSMELLSRSTSAPMRASVELNDLDEWVEKCRQVAHSNLQHQADLEHYRIRLHVELLVRKELKAKVQSTKKQYTKVLKSNGKLLDELKELNQSLVTAEAENDALRRSARLARSRKKENSGKSGDYLTVSRDARSRSRTPSPNPSGGTEVSQCGSPSFSGPSLAVSDLEDYPDSEHHESLVRLHSDSEEELIDTPAHAKPEKDQQSIADSINFEVLYSPNVERKEQREVGDITRSNLGEKFQNVKMMEQERYKRGGTASNPASAHCSPTNQGSEAFLGKDLPQQLSIPQYALTYSNYSPYSHDANKVPFELYSSFFNEGEEVPPPAPPSEVRDDHSTRMYEHFLVIGSNPKNVPTHARKTGVWFEEPKILLKYPQTEPLESDDIPHFAFPDLVKVELLDSPSSKGVSGLMYGQEQFQRKGKNCHVFLMQTQKPGVDDKDPNGGVLFGLCVTVKELCTLTNRKGKACIAVSPVSYVVLSRFPFLALHLQIVHSILTLLHVKRLEQHQKHDQNPKGNNGRALGPHQVETCVKLLKDYYETPVPKRGEWTSIVVPDTTPVTFERPSIADDFRTLITNWACTLAYARLSGSDLVRLLELALREFKIIVVDTNLAVLTAAVFSFMSLLRPLRWTGVFLPILPTKLAGFLEAPVPIMVGVTHLPQTINSKDKLSPDTCVWFPSTNEIWCVEDFEECMPGREKLQATLDQHLKELHAADEVVMEVERQKTQANVSPPRSEQATPTNSLMSPAQRTKRKPRKEKAFNYKKKNGKDQVAPFQHNYYPSEQALKAVKDLLVCVHSHLCYLLNHNRIHFSQKNPAPQAEGEEANFAELFHNTQMVAQFMYLWEKSTGTDNIP